MEVPLEIIEKLTEFVKGQRSAPLITESGLERVLRDYMSLEEFRRSLGEKAEIVYAIKIGNFLNSEFYGIFYTSSPLYSKLQVALLEVGESYVKNLKLRNFSL
jgi:hypothetical protein